MTFQWKTPINLKSLAMLAASIVPLVAYGLAHNAFSASWQGPLGWLVAAYTGAMMYVHHGMVPTPDVQDPGVMGATSGPTQGTSS